VAAMSPLDGVIGKRHGVHWHGRLADGGRSMGFGGTSGLLSPSAITFEFGQRRR
jgi:hypothetical protein